MNASRDGEEVAGWEVFDFFEGRDFDLEREREREVVLFLVAERRDGRLRAEVDGAIILRPSGESAHSAGKKKAKLS